MTGDSMRMYETFYGIHTNDWSVNFGTFSNHHKLLVKDYISDGTDCEDASTASDSPHSFLYPHHIKKTYFIEGVIEGHVTFGSDNTTAYLCAYRVSVCKINENATDNELFTTGWVTVDKTLAWNSTYSVGDEIVLPFWIDAWNKAELSEKDRIYVKVESTCSNSVNCIDCAGSSCTNINLWHSNDSTWEDLKITIPFLGI